MTDFRTGPAAGHRQPANGSWPGAADRRLRTGDLTLWEIRDLLWLASGIASTARSTSDGPEVRKDPEPSAAEATGDSAPKHDPADRQEPGAEPEPAPDDTPGPERWAAGVSRFVRPTQIDRDAPEMTAPLRWPTTAALPRTGRLARALRPFTRTSPSPWTTVLDEEATATRAAQDGTWLPEWRPAPWHRFEIALVVDTAQSMQVWQHLIREFRELLERLGAFRDVRTYLLDFSPAQDEKLVLRTEGRADAPRSRRELVDPTGNRIIVVLTDAVAAAWHSGAASRLLAKWGQTMPVAALQTLPHRLWHWSGLSPQRIKLSAPAPGAPNRQLRTTPSREGTSGHSGTAVPVLALSAEWLTDWARLVAQPGTGWVETTAVIVDPLDDILGDDVQPQSIESGTAHEQVLRFRTIASAEAFQLAGLLAAAPLNLPTMRAVQRVLLPGSDTSALAEVLLGGLLKRLSAAPSPADPCAPAFEFHEGVRQELLAGGRRSDTVQVARLVGDYGRNVAVLRNFREAVDDPDNAGYPELSEANAPYLRVQEALFRALSGRHAARAKHLEHGLHRLLSQPGRVRSAAGSGTVQNGSAREQPSEKDFTLTTTESLSPAEETQFQPEGGDVTTPGFAPPAEGGQRTGQPRVWGSIPLRNPNFVGREDLLTRLRSRLAEPGTTAVLPEALHGMGGVGKTQTVVEYIYRYASEYDLIWWVAAEHPTQIRSSLTELASRLGVTATESSETAVPSVLEALRTGEPFSRWLLVFDNADRPEALRQFLPAGAGHIIVTSRNSQWSGVAQTVEVDLFTRTESEELLTSRDETIDSGEARQLAEALGDLPLAIEQAAAWRAQTGMPVGEYLELLEENRTELLEAGASSDYDLPVAAAWNVALARLRNEYPAALELLQVCAFFGPTPIVREVFTKGRAVPVPDALREALADPIKLNRAIREISRYSLAKIDHRSNTLQLHRLVQAVLKNQVDEGEHENMRHVVHLLLSGGDPGDPTEPADWSRYEDLLPHVVASRGIRCDDEWARRLVANLVRYLVNVGDYEGARDLSGQALEELRAKVGESHLDTLDMARQHGIALRRIGRLQQARELNQKTYELLASSAGEDSERMLAMEDVLANDLRAQGLFIQEREIRLRIHERAGQIFGEDDPETLRYAHNLSGTLRLTGEFFKARELDDDILRRRTVILGVDHAQTLRALNAIAIDVRECGQYVDACRLQEEALGRERVLFGDDHVITRGGGRSLVVAKIRAGEPDAARVLSEEWHERARRRVGDEHQDTATNLMNLSTCHRMLGDLDKAVEYGQRSLQDMAQAQGDEHPFTLIAAMNVAVIQRMRGAVDDARQINERVVGNFRAWFGHDHPCGLVAAANLASDLTALGESAAAHELDADTWERSARVLGAEHPASLGVALNLSLDLNLLGRTDEAAILYAKTMKSLRTMLGEAHPVTAAAAESVRVDCDTDTMQL